ncbi:hypothetical protein L6452_08520 [Arctium lappa]|uniref:Uncharacterized protein n=1 Tax=Arctium lappa TaxID=4217 RepID=A0ACB9DHH6_ARCLA|nr:hypothetical protein L6452_08520 [Arctium lappa]
MASDSSDVAHCFRLWEVSKANLILDGSDLELLHGFCQTVYDSKVQGKIYSKPMLWIGIYIAVASLFCVLLMAADLFHGFRNRKLWFPSKYFTLNTASITVITITMKLLLDMTSQMPGFVDKLSKLGSMTFMCTMMANLMPSVASTANRDIFANVAAINSVEAIVFHAWGDVGRRINRLNGMSVMKYFQDDLFFSACL